MRRPKHPESETIALALRLLRAALPDCRVDVELLDPGPRTLAVVDALGGRTLSEGPKVRMVRTEIDGARVTLYQHLVKAEVTP